jgi:UDP-GlcNAc:undecaprenyl-phosphate GlcNAc-1-phosphate transferase
MYFLSFVISLILTLALTPIIKHLALKGKIVDKPAGRKKDWRPVPLLGGWAIFLAVVAVLWWQKEALLVGDLNYSHWLGVLIGSLLILIGGSLDDKYNLSPAKQIIFPVLACLAVIAGGVGIEKITSPVAGLVWLDNWQVPLGFWFGQMHYFVVVADIFTFLWLMGMMYTTKLLDGVDGLVTGVAGIGSLIIFLFTMTTRYYQPDIALAALVLAAACAAFLVYNWTPAKIYLGEGGALWLGFILGVLSIISGGKIAVALLVMGVPILDVAWTITRRTLQGKNPF